MCCGALVRSLMMNPWLERRRWRACKLCGRGRRGNEDAGGCGLCRDLGVLGPGCSEQALARRGRPFGALVWRAV